MFGAARYEFHRVQRVGGFVIHQFREAVRTVPEDGGTRRGRVGGARREENGVLVVTIGAQLRLVAHEVPRR